MVVPENYKRPMKLLRPVSQPSPKARKKSNVTYAMMRQITGPSQSAPIPPPRRTTNEKHSLGVKGTTMKRSRGGGIQDKAIRVIKGVGKAIVTGKAIYHAGKKVFNEGKEVYKTVAPYLKTGAQMIKGLK